jgi:hypothetical protein
MCALAILLVASLVGVATTGASGRFSVRSLRGTYVFSGSGTLMGGTVQAATVGLNSFDGAGGCGIKARINAGGTVLSVTAATCVYTVNADGTGTIRLRFNDPSLPVPFVSNIAIVDEKEVHFMLQDELGGTVASGIAKKQSSGRRD